MTATQNAAPIIDSALKLADLGFKVFPIRPLGKAPAFEGADYQARDCAIG